MFRMTAGHVESCVRRQRAHEARAQELATATRETRRLAYAATAEAQMEDVRLRKELRARATEAATAAEAEARARSEREEEERRTRDEMLGAVLEEERLRREKQEREIQRICEVRVVCVYVFM